MRLVLMLGNRFLNAIRNVTLLSSKPGLCKPLPYLLLQAVQGSGKAYVIRIYTGALSPMTKPSDYKSIY